MKIPGTNAQRKSKSYVLIAFVKSGTKPTYAYVRADKLPDRYGCNEINRLKTIYHTRETVLNENCYDFVHDHSTGEEWYVRRKDR